jgi:hypothetical protein
MMSSELDTTTPHRTPHDLSMGAVELKHPRPCNFNSQTVSKLEKAIEQDQRDIFLAHNSKISLRTSARCPTVEPEEPKSAFSSDSSATSDCEPQQKHRRSTNKSGKPGGWEAISDKARFPRRGESPPRTDGNDQRQTTG